MIFIFFYVAFTRIRSSCIRACGLSVEKSFKKNKSKIVICSFINRKRRNCSTYKVRMPFCPKDAYLFYSILFYPITLEGRRGTTGEFATIPFHLDLFSAALVELAKSIHVHSLILSSHPFFCLPLFLFSFHCAL